VREADGVALLDARGVELARAGEGPDGEPALLDSRRP